MESFVKTYQHQQRATLMLVVFAIIALVDLVLGLWFTHLTWIAIPVLAICAWLFHSLTIEIADGELRWRFGSGLIRKRVPLDQIISARAVRTTMSRPPTSYRVEPSAVSTVVPGEYSMRPSTFVDAVAPSQ